LPAATRFFPLRADMARTLVSLKFLVCSAHMEMFPKIRAANLHRAMASEAAGGAATDGIAALFAALGLPKRVGDDERASLATAYAAEYMNEFDSLDGSPEDKLRAISAWCVRARVLAGFAGVFHTLNAPVRPAGSRAGRH